VATPLPTLDAPSKKVTTVSKALAIAEAIKCDSDRSNPRDARASYYSNHFGRIKKEVSLLSEGCPMKGISCCRTMTKIIFGF